jgi:glycosyltransferase involved in cell wall biosynthesis
VPAAFPPGTRVENSPLVELRYRRAVRRAILFSGLRNRSPLIREELAQLVAARTAAELLTILTQDLASNTAPNSSINPGHHETSYRRNRRFLKFLQHAEGKRAAFDLAWLYSNQGIESADLERAQTIYRWLIARYGITAFSQMHRADLTILALRLGDAELLALATPRLRNTLADLQRFAPRRLKTIQALGIQEATSVGFGRDIDWSFPMAFLRADHTNPFRGSARPLAEAIADPVSQAWLRTLSLAVLPRGAAPLAFAPPNNDSNPIAGPLDQLSIEGQLKPVHGPLITVVVSCFKPNWHLVTSVQSILASTYQDLEVLVIDDASGPEFDLLLDQVAALDARVRVLRQSENGGTYRIRNRALDEARGELITFNDSDDWMHPQRLEWQALPLIRSNPSGGQNPNPAKIGNISMSTRLTDNLEAIESARRMRIGLSEPSLLFWRRAAVRKIGYFDSVRKGADSEYRQRLQRAFRQQLDVIAPFRCLTLQRADNGGLTQGDLGFRWIIDYRLTYKDVFQAWHKTGERLYLPKDGKREFFAPRQMRFTGQLATKQREVDLVIGGNFNDKRNVTALLPEIEAALAASKTVAIWQLSAAYPTALTRTLRPAIIELLNSGKLTTCYPADELEVQELRLRAPSAFMGQYRDLGFSWNVKNIRFDTLAEAADLASETWVAQGPGLEELLAARVEAAFRSRLRS